MHLIKNFASTSPFKTLEDLNLLSDAETAFHEEVTHNNLPDTPHIKNAYFLFCQHLLEHYSTDNDMETLASVAQRLPLASVQLLQNFGPDHVRESEHSLSRITNEDMLTAALAQQTLQRTSANEKSTLQAVIGEEAIDLLQAHSAILKDQGQMYQTLPGQAQAVHLAIMIQDISLFTNLVNAKKETDIEEEMRIGVITLYRHGINMNLGGNTELEKLYLGTQKHMIACAKAETHHDTPGVVPFPIPER